MWQEKITKEWVKIDHRNASGLISFQNQSEDTQLTVRVEEPVEGESEFGIKVRYKHNEDGIFVHNDERELWMKSDAEVSWVIFW